MRWFSHRCTSRSHSTNRNPPFPTLLLPSRLHRVPLALPPPRNHQATIRPPSSQAHTAILVGLQLLAINFNNSQTPLPKISPIHQVANKSRRNKEPRVVVKLNFLFNRIKRRLRGHKNRERMEKSAMFQLLQPQNSIVSSDATKVRCSPALVL